MKSEIAKRTAASENDPAIRNPFGVMDVPNPNDDDVTQFARSTVPEESGGLGLGKVAMCVVVEPLERCCGSHHPGRCPG